MTKRTEFLQKLKQLLEEYDVSISFSVGDCSDTHGLYDEKLVFEHRVNKATFEEEMWLEVAGWSCNAFDIQEELK